MGTKITLEKCPCGHPSCTTYWLVGIGHFCQGSGFTEAEAKRIANLLNSERRTKFDYYLIHFADGTVKGTDDSELAMKLSESDDWFVIDAEQGRWLLNGTVGEYEEITRMVND